MGLAHFLEHMLKLGTGKFPIENEYDKFVSAHAGRKNAATGDLILDVGPLNGATTIVVP